MDLRVGRQLCAGPDIDRPNSRWPIDDSKIDAQLGQTAEINFS